MKMLIASLLIAMTTCSTAVAQSACQAFFKKGADLYLEPQDTQMALFEPDCYAWRLFVALNWPSRKDQCGADPGKQLGAEGETVWEKWISKHDVFLPGAKAPATWDSHCGTVQIAKTLAPSAQLAAARTQMADQAGDLTPFEPPTGDASTAADEEVRMNRETLEFIASKRLYSRNEQMRLAAAKIKTIEFPAAAKEVKAHWVKLEDPADFGRYHIGKASDGTVYGLVGWHVTTKDLPRWFWATFEHVDNETRWPTEDPGSFAGWSVKPIDRFACDGEAVDCGKFPRGIGLDGTKWENYRLKATQIDWVDSLGEPTIVVNSKIEGGFIQSQSSCMSCHALAMMGEAPPPMPFSIINLDIPPDSSGRVANFKGVVDADDRRPRNGVDPNQHFLQLDFVWSLRNAQPEN
ncbi:hypothetical protein GHK68_09395 [Sinorhizobium meliloti]|uniref:hypothetical protein n=1 Tax=Rhizobium meliloti TaxID=382 RepID=UPI0012953F9C|nr:hypothetical protein [Sinorhizobium meliloti]MQW42545.1 hypothetical protein [Sinorhizobium meliloti]